MIESEACTINILLALNLALASVISYDHEFCFHLVLILICFEKMFFSNKLVACIINL
jgi:hypothetical protein